MASLTRLSAYNKRVDSLLQGVRTEDLLAADRDLAIRHAVREYSKALPKRETLEFAGDGGSYYLLYGLAEDVDETTRDAGIDLASSSADQQLGVLFTLDYRMEIHQVNLWLSRTGATVAGSLVLTLYTTATSLPSQPVAVSESVDIDDAEGAARGFYKKVRFPFADDQVVELPAGTYCAVLSSSGYTYANGTNEVIVGVDQSSVTNSVVTYNGSAWAAYGTASAGIVEVIAGILGWREGSTAIVSVEYPAALISSDEEPQVLDEEDVHLFRSMDGHWLYLPNHSPSTGEKVRLTYSRPYTWTEATDPLIDIPSTHYEAVSCLATAICCELLAVRYGQKREATISADSVERRTQSDVYLSLANRLRKSYKLLAGLEAGEGRPGGVLVDIDYAFEVGSDFLFHRKSKR